MATSGSRGLERLQQGLSRLEDALLALLLGAMILIASAQIFLRNFFDSSVSWGDPALRALVLWVGLLGALAATRRDRHITIDVISQLVSERVRGMLALVTRGFAAAVCGVVAYHSLRFLQSEIEYETVAFAGIPAWWVEAVIPFAFAMMAMRFAIGLGVAIRDVVAGPGEVEPGC